MELQQQHDRFKQRLQEAGDCILAPEDKLDWLLAKDSLCAHCRAAHDLAVFEFMLRSHNRRLQEAVLDHTEDPRKGNPTSPYVFVTFTLDNDNSQVDVQTIMAKMKAIAKSKSVFVVGYYGCIEYTLQGRPHAHCLFYVPKSGKRGFAKSHLKNFWKYGSMDIRRLNGNMEQSYSSVVDYINKEEPGKPNKLFFGEIASIPKPGEDKVVLD